MDERRWVPFVRMFVPATNGPHRTEMNAIGGALGLLSTSLDCP